MSASSNPTRDQELRPVLQHVFGTPKKEWSLSPISAHFGIRAPERLLQVVHFVSDFLLTEECDSLQRFPKHPSATEHT
jgi:hypothetical protein